MYWHVTQFTSNFETVTSIRLMQSRIYEKWWHFRISIKCHQIYSLSYRGGHSIFQSKLIWYPRQVYLSRFTLYPEININNLFLWNCVYLCECIWCIFETSRRIEHLKTFLSSWKTLFVLLSNTEVGKFI